MVSICYGRRNRASFKLALTIAMTFRRFVKQKSEDYRALGEGYYRLQTEIRERNLTEEALQQSTILFRTVFETSPDAVVITRIEDSTIVDVNSGITAYTGYDRSEVIGRSVIDIGIWKPGSAQDSSGPGLRKRIRSQLGNRFPHQSG